MNNLRISGLASGMDTDAMVQSLMKVERLKVDRYEQNKQIALWRQESYNNINKIFANFILNTKKDIGLNQINMRGVISSTAYNRLDYVKKATSSDETKATVSSTTNAVNGSFEIEIKSLAKSASFTSVEFDENANFGKSLKFTISTGVKDKDGQAISKTIEVDNSNGITIDEIVKSINTAKVIKDGKEESLGITAFYDKENKRLFMQTMETGEGIDIVISDLVKESDAINPLERHEVAGIDYKGKSAEIIYNGITLKYSNNNFTLNGINIEAKNIGKTTIKAETNVQGIMEKVEKLVNDYNELIDKASKLLGEKKYSSYHPLSMEEKKAMHEDDVKLWEEKAKSGLLSNDGVINKTLQTMRRYLYEDVQGIEGSFKHITEIGITTEKYARGSAGGKLQIDKDKLMDAILKDPEGVMELLFKEPNYNDEKLKGVNSLTNERDLSRDQISEKRNQSGIFTRMYDELISGMQNIIDKSGSGENADLYRSVKGNILLDFVTNKSSISDIDKDVLNMNKKIDDLNDMLVRKENSYYAKFANMEKMLQQMYSQSNWLSQQFMK